MSTIYEGLMAKDMKELQVLAMQHGLPKPHHKNKKETVVKMIIEAATAKPAPQEQSKNTVEAPVAEDTGPKYMSREAVEAMLEPIRRTKPEFQSIYSNDDTVVTFRYKGAEECHNLTTRPSWLKLRADVVARGRVSPRAYSSTQFSGGDETGKNAYTNVVLV